MTLRIGSLCSGYGGLDLAVEAVFDAHTAWFCEYDRDPSAILAHHWPDTPNHGDVKNTDWSQVEPVDILTAGYPCQPFSHAGKRKGSDDPRHLWPDVARAIGALRPRLVVLENVRGHVSLGLADVLGDLSGLGYDARWGVVRAADAGAPHGRARIFIVASSDAQDDRRQGGDTGGSEPAPARPARSADAPADADGERHGRGQDGRGLGRVDGADAGTSWEWERARGVAVDRGAETSADATGERRGEGWPEPARRIGRPAPVVGGAAAPDADSDGRCRVEGVPVERGAVHGDGGRDSHGRVTGVEWGAYAAAVARWEHVIGRPAPRPTEPGRTSERLSPAFVEWMMGLPAGHVTDVPGLSRNAQLKALGNGVVPQQAALALRLLLDAQAAA